MSDQPRPKVVSGAKPETGHYDEFMAHAAHFLYRAYQELSLIHISEPTRPY